MKIIHHDDWTLEVRPRGGIILLAVGLTFVVTSPLLLFLLGQTTTLSCERVRTAEPRCVLARSLLGFETSSESLVVLGAHLDEDTDSDGDTTYRVILETDTGTRPLTLYASSGYQKKAGTVDEIRRFAIDSTAPSLAITSKGTLGLWIAGAMTAIDLVMVVFGLQMASTRWIFARDHQIITRKRGGLLGRGEVIYPMGDVTGVQLGSSRDSDGSTTYRIELVTQAGIIPMTAWYSSGYKRKEEDADVIRQFLRLT